jgi:hypothetical protein
MEIDMCGVKLLKGRGFLLLEEHTKRPADHVILGGAGGEGCEFFFGTFSGLGERGSKGPGNENITE